MPIYDGPISDGRRLQMHTVSTQDVATNASTLTLGLWMVSTNGSVRYSDNMGVGIALNGWQAFWWQGSASYGAGTYQLAVSTHTIPHDANGNATIRVAGAVTDMSGSWGLNVGDIWEALPNIPRGTTPNIGTVDAFTTGTETTINLPRANSGFTHDVSYKFGTKTGVIATGAGVTAKWTPSHDLATEIPNASSSTVEITTVTKSGTTVIATKKSYFWLRLGTSVVPTISTVTWDDANPTVKTAVGAFVQGLSLIKGTVNSAGVYGSTITSESLTIAGSTVNEGQVWQPGASGTITASGSATDSRGRTATKAANFNVLAYAPPSLTQALVRRATTAAGAVGDGAYLRMDLTALVQSLKPATTEKNALKLKVETRPTDGVWTVRNNLTHTALSYSNALVMVTGGAAFPLNQSFEVRITITDNVGQSVVAVRQIGTGGAAFSMGATGTGHGKIWERGGIDVAGKAYFADDAIVTGEVLAGATTPLCPIGAVLEWYAASTPAGYLRLEGQAVSRTTYSKLFALWGTTFGAGNGSTTFNLPDRRGRVAVGVDSADIDFGIVGAKYGTKTHTLTTAEMPAHGHNLTTYAPGSGSTSGIAGTGDGAPYQSVSVNTAGSGNAHNNVQPSIAAHFIVRAL